jgi:hypothetical protein
VGIDVISQLLQQSDVRGSRSTVMSPLGWLIAIEVAALTSALKFGAPVWAFEVLVIAISATAAVYILTYIYFVKVSPDALRSERFWLQKMALEKVVRGDNVSGFVASDEVIGLGTTPAGLIADKDRV